MKTSTSETTRERTVSDLTEKAIKNYEQIVRTGLRLQEEVGRCWTSMLSHSTSLHDWQRPITNFTTMTNSILPDAQKRMQEALDLVEKNTRTGVELMKKAADAAQTTSLAESQNRWMDFWNSSLEAARANTEAVMQLNTRAMDAWLNVVQKNTEAAAQGRYSKS
jgi:hypothetical protein